MEATEPKPIKRLPVWLKTAFVLTLLYAGLVLVYSNSIYPGVRVNGIQVGGMDREQAIAEVQERWQEYQGETVPIVYGNTTVRVNPREIELDYDVERAVDMALDYGRKGRPWTVLAHQLRLFVGGSPNITVYKFSDDKLFPYVLHVDTEANREVKNAVFNVSGTSVTITPDESGRRLNRGGLILRFKERLAEMSVETIAAPVSEQKPLVDTVSLEPVRELAERYISAQVELDVAGRKVVISPADIVNWLSVTRKLPANFDQTRDVADIYSGMTAVSVSVDEDKVETFVEEVAKSVDKPAQNAVLTIQDGRATIFRPSITGAKLDRDKAKDEIVAALSKQGDDRKIALKVEPLKPEITEGNLNDLGIQEMISEGVSYFTGSIPARVKNIQLGAALYNGLLVKPGETFSFNKYFINVDAEHGWEPGLSIIGDKIEPIFGGGICQVSSTIYRAALLAGLPINARTNHAYAVSYYTQPYGVPGVDATVYNPGVDFKFTNDTGSHILIQTIIQGTTLKFQFYGTKTKVGRIRGPYFISGSIDHTKPSKTIFYRDVLDLNGKVLETHSVTTSYKSSLDFKQVTTP